MKARKEKLSVLWHQSGVNPQGEPFVQLLRGQEILCQLDVDQARDHARAVLMAAEAAEQDAFMLSFAREVIGGDERAAAGLLMRFREYREQTTDKRGGPVDRDDWVMPPKDEMPDYGEFWKKREP